MSTDTYMTGRTATGEPVVTIPLSEYVEKVKRIQILEDQIEMDRLNREKDEMEANWRNALCAKYAAEETLKRLKEDGIE